MYVLCTRVCVCVRMSVRIMNSVSAIVAQRYLWRNDDKRSYLACRWAPLSATHKHRQDMRNEKRGAKQERVEGEECLQLVWGSQVKRGMWTAILISMRQGVIASEWCTIDRYTNYLGVVCCSTNQLINCGSQDFPLGPEKGPLSELLEHERA